MYLDLNFLAKMATDFKKAYDADPDGYDQGRHVFTISVKPESGIVDAHVQWSMIRDLLETVPDATVKVSQLQQDNGPASIYLQANPVHGVMLSVVLFHEDVTQLLDEADIPYISDGSNTLALFELWRKTTKWHEGGNYDERL